MGMVAALGDDVAMNCAAARAGIVRAGALEHYRLRSAVDGAAEPVIGHAARLLTRGFEGDIRLVRLLQGALRNLASRTVHLGWKAGRVGCYVALPSSDRTRRDPEEPDPEEEQQAQEPTSPAEEFDRAQGLLAKAVALAAWPTQAQLAGVRTSGHAGGLECLQDACIDLQAGRFEAALVLAADSLIDAQVLDWLSATNRLKCDGVPDGVQPGEGAVALALSSQSRDATDKPAAQLLAVHTDKEPRHLLAGVSARGEVLASVVSQAWSQARAPLPWLIMDLNGEAHRAMDWGYALVRLRASSAAFSEPQVWHTAASFGDTGAASGLIGICMSVRSWERDYAPSDR